MAVAQPDGWSVRALLPACETLLPKLSGKSSGQLTFSEGRCFGIVASALQFSSTVFREQYQSCPPKDVKFVQAVVDVVFALKWQLIQEGGTKILDENFALMAAVALRQSFPCDNDKAR